MPYYEVDDLNATSSKSVEWNYVSDKTKKKNYQTLWMEYTRDGWWQSKSTRIKRYWNWKAHHIQFASEKGKLVENDDKANQQEFKGIEIEMLTIYICLRERETVRKSSNRSQQPCSCWSYKLSWI